METKKLECLRKNFVVVLKKSRYNRRAVSAYVTNGKEFVLG